MAKIAEIEGIGPAYSEALGKAGITSVENLLKMGSTTKGRSEIASASGLDTKRILEWVNRADLARVKGIGSEYADLLEAAGVDTVPELGMRNAANLHAKMKEVNESKSLVRSLPSESMVEKWVEEAKTLPRVVEY